MRIFFGRRTWKNGSIAPRADLTGAGAGAAEPVVPVDTGNFRADFRRIGVPVPRHNLRHRQIVVRAEDIAYWEEEDKR